jgi:hypothetical protein
MTKAQKKTLNQIKNQIPYFDFYGNPDMYEIKEWKEWEPDCTGAFMVTFTTGVKDDEGTYAAIFCRKYRTFFVGTRGGVYVMNKNCHFVSTSVFDLMNKHYRN